MVLLIDNFASGNNTLDKAINVLYVSCVNETFLYLVISVICDFFSFNYEQYIGYVGDLSSMKFILSLIICSQVHTTCMPPYKWPDTFNTSYDCMMFGYQESIKKMKEIGREEANKYGVYIRFVCTPENTV